MKQLFPGIRQWAGLNRDELGRGLPAMRRSWTFPDDDKEPSKNVSGQPSLSTDIPDGAAPI